MVNEKARIAGFFWRCAPGSFLLHTRVRDFLITIDSLRIRHHPGRSSSCYQDLGKERSMLSGRKLGVFAFSA